MAIRLGNYTGKLYDDTVDPRSIKECCHILTFGEKLTEKEESQLEQKRLELKQKCKDCTACEESKKGKLNYIMTVGEKVKYLEELFRVTKPDDIDFEEWVETLENMEAGFKTRSAEYNKSIIDKELKRFINEGALSISDEEIREACPEKIGVCYGFNNYKCDLEQINELKDAILKDYPNMKDEDIEVWYIRSTESISHAKFTMLRINIPTEDFIKLRQNGEIYCL